MRLLVTGTMGQVATALAQRAGPEMEVVLVGRPQLDLAAPKDLATIFRKYAPQAIISAAAYTQVDKAESEPALAYAVNGAGAGAVATAAGELGIPIIHLSTDYVFDGKARQPLLETDPTGPLNVYGDSKLKGEQAVARSGADFAIIRTAWVYAPFGANFVRTILRLAETRKELRVVDDQIGVPTSALDIAAACEIVARNLLSNPGEDKLRGTFHLTGSGVATSWASFARTIIRLSVERGGPYAQVIPIAASEYPTPAARPAWSCLSGEKLAHSHGIRLPNWECSLAEVVGRLAPGH